MIAETSSCLPLPQLLTLLSLAGAAVLACGAGLSVAWFMRQRTPVHLRPGARCRWSTNQSHSH